MTIERDPKNELVTKMVDNMNHGLNSAKEALNEAQGQQKKYIDLNKREEAFKVGDLALCSTKFLEVGNRNQNLSHKFCALMRITHKYNDWLYHLALLLNLQIRPMFHISQLKRHHSSSQELC